MKFKFSTKQMVLFEIICILILILPLQIDNKVRVNQIIFSENKEKALIQTETTNIIPNTNRFDRADSLIQIFTLKYKLLSILSGNEDVDYSELENIKQRLDTPLARKNENVYKHIEEELDKINISLNITLMSYGIIIDQDVPKNTIVTVDEITENKIICHDNSYSYEMSKKNLVIEDEIDVDDDIKVYYKEINYKDPKKISAYYAEITK